MFGPALRAWDEQNFGTARFLVVDGNLVLEVLDSPTTIVKINPEWLKGQGYAHHVEDGGETIRVGVHVFRRVRFLREPFAAYELTTDPPT